MVLVVSQHSDITTQGCVMLSNWLVRVNCTNTRLSLLSPNNFGSQIPIPPQIVSCHKRIFLLVLKLVTVIYTDPVDEDAELISQKPTTSDDVTAEDDDIITADSADQSESAPAMEPEPEYEVPISTKPAEHDSVPDQQEEEEPREVRAEPEYDEAEPAYEEVQYGSQTGEHSPDDDLEPVTPLVDDGKHLSTNLMHAYHNREHISIFDLSQIETSANSHFSADFLSLIEFHTGMGCIFTLLGFPTFLCLLYR